MSNESVNGGFRGVPGVPKGWELLRLGPLRSDGKHCCYLDDDGDVQRHDGDDFVEGFYPIVRKIVKPKTFRAFRDTEEYMPHWGKPIVKIGGVGCDSVVSTFPNGVYVACAKDITCVGFHDAFSWYTFADGSPFGVEVISDEG